MEDRHKNKARSVCDWDIDMKRINNGHRLKDKQWFNESCYCTFPKISKGKMDNMVKVTRFSSYLVVDK